MNVASLKLCKDLYELSGWSDTIENFRESAHLTKDRVPAYDLGYLMRKLPRQSHVYQFGANEWLAYAPGSHDHSADTPENAATKLCIELLNQGVLKKGAA